MEEIWKVIESFPNYEVSNMGNVRRLGKVSNMRPKKAKGDAWFVKLTRDGGVYSKTVKTLVAEAFVPVPPEYDPDIFDTPILCSLTTDHIRADIIQWRPRWFAIQFRRQLHEESYPLYWDIPVMNLHTRTQHASILTAAIRDGVLMKDIYRSAGEGVQVPPTGHRYEFMFRIEKGLGTVHWDWV